MFQQFYEPHPALKGFVNNIMIHQVNLDAAQPQLNFSIPPLPEHCLFFYVKIVRTQKIQPQKRSKPFPLSW